MTVLLVDDNADQLTIRSLLLGQQGFETLPARSREEALHVLEGSNVECAVVDLCLPDLETGLSTLRDLRLQASAMRLIALTGYGAGTWQHTAAGELANEVVVKGSGVSGLIDALKKTANAACSLR